MSQITPRSSAPARDAPRWYFAIFAVFYAYSGVFLFLAPRLLIPITSPVLQVTLARIGLAVIHLAGGLLCAAAFGVARYRLRWAVCSYLGGVASMSASVAVVSSITVTHEPWRPALWLVIFALHLHYLRFHLPAHEARRVTDALDTLAQEGARHESD